MTDRGGSGALATAVDGVLALDKPAGISSNAALQAARRLFGAARAGHTGTLDPMASGLLVLCFGQATRFASLLLDADKNYRARVRLGVRTATGDAEGEVIETRPVHASRERIEAALERFRGEIEQTPPMHSALKHRGRPLYAWARRGVEIERRPRRVFVRRLELIALRGEEAELDVCCSKGTYIRALAEGLGAALGCGAHLAALVRTTIGSFSLERATTLDELRRIPPPERRARLLPPASLLAALPRVSLDSALAARFRLGQAVPAGAATGKVAVFSAEGVLLGIGTSGPDALLRPQRVIAPPGKHA